MGGNQSKCQDKVKQNKERNRILLKGAEGDRNEVEQAKRQSQISADDGLIREENIRTSPAALRQRRQAQEGLEAEEGHSIILANSGNSIILQAAGNGQYNQTGEHNN